MGCPHFSQKQTCVCFYNLTIIHVQTAMFESQINDPYEPVLFSESRKQNDQCSPIPERMTLMTQFVSLNQQHCDRSGKSIERMTLMDWFFWWITCDSEPLLNESDSLNCKLLLSLLLISQELPVCYAVVKA